MLQARPTTGSPTASKIGHIPTLLLAALILTGANQAMACNKPAFSGTIPDGNSASEEDMANIQQTIRQFVSDSEAYIACIDGDRSAQRLRNETIDDMEKVAAAFNRELRKFRRR